MRKISIYKFITAAVAAASLSIIFLLQAKNMTEIKFELGRNIVETARESGLPKYSARDINGFITYSVNDLPADVSARFARPGYDVSFASLFALTMYASQDNKNNLAVDHVTLQFSTKPFTSHEDGKKFAERVIAQMNSKKWLRHIEELCPAVGGRSAFLNAAGELEQIEGCALDPAYTLTREEWLHMMRLEQSYQWVGDGVLATLRIAYSEDRRGITYNFYMDFDDLALKKRKDALRLQRDLAEGDQKGWKSTEQYQQHTKSVEELIRVLEANARKRGDPVIAR